jgi:hypothetical protein
VGNGGGVQAALLLPAAELAGRAAAPREEGEGVGSARVESRGGVRGCRSGKVATAEGEETAEHCRRRRRICLVAGDEAANCEVRKYCDNLGLRVLEPVKFMRPFKVSG